MCRLLAHVSPRPASFADVLGAGQCELFRFMARLHADGWGAMWVADDSPLAGSGAGPVLERTRSADGGHDDEALADLLRHRRHRAVVGHLRLATRSLGGGLANTHPFLADGIGLAHNGAIVPTSRLRAMVEPDLLDSLDGVTDSELYHAVVRQQARAGGSLTAAVARAVAQIRAAYPRPSLNAMVLTTRELVIVHASSHAPVPYEDFTASVLADDLPMHHDEAYFRMSYQRFPDGSLAVASAGLDTTGWQPLPEDSVSRVDLLTLTLEVCALRPGGRLVPIAPVPNPPAGIARPSELPRGA